MTRISNISKSFKMMSWFRFSKKSELECCNVLENDTED